MSPADAHEGRPCAGTPIHVQGLGFPIRVQGLGFPLLLLYFWNKF